MNILLGILANNGGGHRSVTPPPINPTPPTGTPVGKAKLFYPGDSNTANGIYVGAVEAALDTDKFDPGQQYGHAGYTVSQLDGILDWVMVKVFDPNKRNVAVMMLGTNDINNGGNGQVCLNALEAISIRLRNFGFHICGIIFMDPARDLSGNNTNANYFTVRDGLRADYNNPGKNFKWERLVDVSQNPYINGWTPAYGATYFGNSGIDHLHLSTAGYQELALGDNMVLDTVNDLITDPCYVPDPFTGGVVNNAAHTFTGTPVQDQTAPIQYTLDAGRTVHNLVGGLPLSISNSRIAGLVGIRYGKVGNNNPSAWLWNGTDITGPEMATELVAWTDPRISGTENFNRSGAEFIYNSGYGSIEFDITEGFLFAFDYGVYGGGKWECLIDGISQGVNYQTTQGTAIFDIHTGTSTTKHVELLGQPSGGSYCLFSAVTLYGY